jgi:hypothetical protein
VLASLAGLPSADAIDALNKLRAAARTSTVRNPSAYLAGVLRRLVPPLGGEADAGEALLTPSAQDILDDLYQQGLVRRGDLDGRSLRLLAGRPTDVQTLVMQTFRDRNL